MTTLTSAVSRSDFSSISQVTTSSSSDSDWSRAGSHLDSLYVDVRDRLLAVTSTFGEDRSQSRADLSSYLCSIEQVSVLADIAVESSESTAYYEALDILSLKGILLVKAVDVLRRKLLLAESAGVSTRLEERKIELLLSAIARSQSVEILQKIHIFNLLWLVGIEYVQIAVISSFSYVAEDSAELINTNEFNSEQDKYHNIVCLKVFLDLLEYVDSDSFADGSIVKEDAQEAAEELHSLMND